MIVWCCIFLLINCMSIKYINNVFFCEVKSMWIQSQEFKEWIRSTTRNWYDCYTSNKEIEYICNIKNELRPRPAMLWAKSCAWSIRIIYLGAPEKFLIGYQVHMCPSCSFTNVYEEGIENWKGRDYDYINIILYFRLNADCY
jgi:hypothetical protein